MDYADALEKLEAVRDCIRRVEMSNPHPQHNPMLRQAKTLLHEVLNDLRLQANNQKVEA